VLTDDGGCGAPSLGVGSDAAEQVEELLRLVLFVNELHLVGYSLLLEYNLASLCISAPAEDFFRQGEWYSSLQDTELSSSSGLVPQRPQWCKQHFSKISYAPGAGCKSYIKIGTSGRLAETMTGRADAPAIWALDE